MDDPDSSVNSTDTPFRYAAYANRIRTILLSAHRYVRTTSHLSRHQLNIPGRLHLGHR
jgi:fission process protein 1